MRLVLSRLIPSDVDAIVPTCFKAFKGQPLTTVFFGHEGPSGFAHTRSWFLKSISTDPHDMFMKIEDLDAPEVEVDLLDDSGHSRGKEMRKRIVCIGHWKIYTTYVPPKESEQEKKPDEDQFPFLPTAQEKADATVIMEDFMKRRKRESTEPHILCFTLFTDPEYQRKGAGMMMMQWGNDVADAMMLPCWIEASQYGEPLYRKMGYELKDRVRNETKSFTSNYARMRRPQMVARMVGSDLKREQ